MSDAVFALVQKAVARIDLASPERLQDSTIHHHIGAVDLLPFHPVGDASMQDAARTSRSVAERVGRELNIPVLTYGAAHPSGRGLAELRVGRVTHTHTHTRTHARTHARARARAHTMSCG